MSAHRILLLTSCTGQKLHKPPNQLKQLDFAKRLEAHTEFVEREQELDEFKAPAWEMYTGQQHKRLMRGINALSNSESFQTELYVLSAGYGFIHGNSEVLPYECTFQTMNATEIRNWSTFLDIPQQGQSFFQQQADLVIVML